MDLSPFAASVALTFEVIALITVFAAIMPLRWGWKAYPLVVVASVLAATALVFASAGAIYRNGGGFVVHFGMLHLTVASLIGAIAFRLVRRARAARINR